MARIRVVHWREDESESLLRAVQKAGHDVEYEPNGPELVRQIKKSPPDAVVIDLTRLPSHGREVAGVLRGSKATRAIPLVFVDGVVEKVEGIRQWLPDAIFSSRAELKGAIQKALKQRLKSPVTPVPMMVRYHHRSTAQKLGIKEGMRVGVMDAPKDYLRVLGEVPGGIEFVEDPEEAPAITLWFVRNADAYREGLTRMREWAASTRLWVLWPKQAARMAGCDVAENLLRESALEVGLVDYKVCSVDATWSGIALAKRRA